LGEVEFGLASDICINFVEGKDAEDELLCNADAFDQTGPLGLRERITVGFA